MKIKIKGMNASYMVQMEMLLQEHLDQMVCWKDKGLEWTAFCVAMSRTIKLNANKVSSRDWPKKKYVFTMDTCDAFVLRIYFETYNEGNHPYLDFIFNDTVRQIDQL